MRPALGGLFGLALFLSLPALGAEWRVVAPGIRAASVLEGGGQAFELDLEIVRLDAVEARARRRRTASVKELAAGTGARVAVNGGFFDEKAASLGLLVSGGKRLSPLRKADWGVLFVTPQRESRIVHTRDFDKELTVEFAIQAGPRLVVDGKPLTLKPQWDRRTAVGVRPEGRHLVVLVTAIPVSLADLAQLMGEGLGCSEALNLDGGSSTQLWSDLEGVEPVVGFAVANGVVVVPRAPASAQTAPP